MVRAFVMIETAAGSSEQAIERVRTVDHVTEAHIVAGEYDVIAEVDAPSVAEVLGTASDLRSLDPVTDTRTYVAMA